MKMNLLRQLQLRPISPPTASARARYHSTRAGINFLEWAGRLIPQGPVVKTVKEGWKLTWLTLMNELAPQSQQGGFVRASYAFHEDIGGTKFPVEMDRYHVYVGNACPWCHRVVLGIIVLGLEDMISIGEVTDNPERASRGGWIFEERDPITNATDLRGVYDAYCGDSNGFRGRCTAPLLIDKKQKRIVSNESGLIIQNLNSIQIEKGTGNNLRPAELVQEIDDLNDKMYHHVNNGVYKCGFATSQEAYNEASECLFNELDNLESRLAKSRFLLGNKFTECDLRLYPTLIRFDSIYATVFRCSKRRFAQYPNLNRWLCDVYQLQIASKRLQIKHSIDLVDARRSYCELFPINPSGIVVDGVDEEALGLDQDLDSDLITNDDIFYERKH